MKNRSDSLCNAHIHNAEANETRPLVSDEVAQQIMLGYVRFSTGLRGSMVREVGEVQEGRGQRAPGWREGLALGGV